MLDAKEMKLFSRFQSNLLSSSEGHNYDSMLWNMTVFCSNPHFNHSLMHLARKRFVNNKGHEKTSFNEVFFFKPHKRLFANK